MIKEAIEKVVQHISLTESEMEAVMNEIMSGNTTDAQIGSFITALRMKGETVEEITGAAKVMRDKAVKLNIKHDVVIDTCGTGGDRKGTFNVSTAAAFIVASAGIKVAKHGNRSVSSKTGSADVLEALGVNINIDANMAEYMLEKINICFLFAPLYHKATKYALGPRKEIGIRTIFNMLGPLTNPAGTRYQLVGVYDGKLTETIANVLKKLGSISACVVHGSDGTDEVTISSTTKVSELRNEEIQTYIFNPEDYGYNISPLERLKGADAKYNAKLLKEILNGAKGPMRDMAEINSAFALYIAGATDNLKDAIKMSKDIINSGSALKKLNEFVEISAEVSKDE